jgi:hypothetical protein
VKTTAAVLVALLSIVLAGCGGTSGEESKTTTSKAAESIKVQLQEQNFSGEAGTATLSAVEGKTRVDILMASYAANAQPTHIHKGTCEKLNSTPAYPLHNLVKGRSLTVVPISLDDLLKGHYAINVHRSAKQPKVYVACGNISRNAAPAETITTSEGDEG